MGPLYSDHPLCNLGVDELEHFLCCGHYLIQRARGIFHYKLVEDVTAYCQKEKLSDTTLTLGTDYAKACISPNHDENDRIGGWLAISTSRFLHFFAANRPISETVAKELLIVLPRVIEEHIRWIEKVWKYPCKLVHAANSQSSSVGSSLDSTLLNNAQHLSAITRLMRGYSMHRTPPVPQVSLYHLSLLKIPFWTVKLGTGQRRALLIAIVYFSKTPPWRHTVLPYPQLPG